MKIVYTHKEVINILTKRAQALNEIEEVEVTIEKPDNQTESSFSSDLMSYAHIVNMYGNSRFNNSKISAIKELRTLIGGLSLVDAKHIVEATPEMVFQYFLNFHTLVGFGKK